MLNNLEIIVSIKIKSPNLAETMMRSINDKPSHPKVTESIFPAKIFFNNDA